MTSPEEAVASFEAGAGRAELCQTLHVGGLTPRTDVVEATLSAVSSPIFALVRPTADTFRLTPDEIDELIDQVATVVSLGVDGVVIGILDRTGRVDRKALNEIVAAADGRPVTFHRAFDEVEDLLGTLETLIRADVDRVLTSGGASTAWEGRETLRELVTASGNDITVLGGGRIRRNHVRRLVEETGLTEVHARASAIPGVIAGLRES